MELITEIGKGAAAAAAIGAVWLGLCRRFLPTELTQRYGAATAFALAFAAGYALRTERADLIPTSHWQWTPVVACAAAVLGGIAQASGLRFIERRILSLAGAAGAAWFLVPTWPSLEPEQRRNWAAMLAGYFFLLDVAISILCSKFSAARVSAALTASSAGVSALLLPAVSLTFASKSALAAGAMLGVWLAVWFWETGIELRGMCLAYSAAIGGWAFIGCVEPQQPMYGFLILPWAPIGLGISLLVPAARKPGLVGAALSLVGVIAILAATLGWLLLGKDS